MVLHKLIFGILIFCSLNASAQYYHKSNKLLKFVGAAGIAAGPENLISLPKLSGFASFKLGGKADHRFGNFQRHSFYIGTESSIVILFAAAGSISGVAGFKSDRFTLDCSLTRLWLMNPEGDIVSRQTTLNPKIGVMFGPIWMKVGPSVLMTNENIFRDTFGNFLHIGNVPFNLEVNYNLSW